MIDITKHRFLKYLLFGNLYLSEGIVWIMATVIITLYLEEKGFPLPLITVVASVSLIPWFLKFIWGGIADYFNKYGRKPFILIGGLIGACGFFINAFIDPGIALIPFTIMIFFTDVGISFLDVSADAWAIEISEEKERGKISGAMYTGLFFGAAVWSILFGFIAKNYGYPSVFLTAGALVLIIMFFPLIVKEIKIVRERPKISSLLLAEFKKRKTQLLAIFAPISSISGGMIYLIGPLYMKEVLNLDVAQTGLLASVFPISIAAGSAAGGVITDKWGRKPTLYIVFTASIIFFAALMLGDTWMLFAVLYSIVGFLIGAYHSATCAMLMDITNPKIGATQYSAMTSLFNVGEWAGGSLGGTFIAMLGYSRAFLFAGWFFGPTMLILYLIKFRKNVRR